MIYDTKKYEDMDVIRIAGENFYMTTWPDETVELPEGTYTFLTEFSVLDNNVFLAGIKGYAYIILENVTIDSDITIEFGHISYTKQHLGKTVVIPYKFNIMISVFFQKNKFIGRDFQ